MFVLKSLGRMILGNTDQKELLSLPHGSFWRVEIDPKTKIIKSRVEYFSSKDASLVLARGDEGIHSYRLIAQAADEPVNGKSSSSISSISESRPFRLSAPLSFTKSKKRDTESIFFYWNEPAEPHVFWEYVPLTQETSMTTIEMFQMTIAQCIYEAEKKKSHQTATDSELQKYILNDLDEGEARAKETGKSGSGSGKSQSEFNVPEELITFRSEQAGFYVFDSASSLFVQKDAEPVRALISRDPKKPFEYWLHIVGGQERVCHKQRLDPDATQHLDRPSFSFIWCHFTENAYIWTYSLKFPETTAVLAFTNSYNQAIYEILNHEKWSKLDKDDAAYLLDPMMDVDMGNEEDAPVETELSERASDSDSESESSDDNAPEATVKFPTKASADKNQMLAVGYKTDRSFVTRGSSIGVFKHQADDQLGFVSELKVQDLAGRSFSPATKMMLHQEDQSLLLMNPDDQHRIYRMDLNRGAVVDEWTVHDEAKITAMVPDSKYAQMTGQSTFIGLNANSIFRVDPRLAGTKRVDNEMKSYVVKNKFSCAATTGAGELAVASEKGEIRLFNKLDKRAKTLLPMFGDAIIGIDVTESGKYILATCKTYLLLINTEIEGEQQALGFSKPMGSKKPLPKRLQLKPEHIAYMGSVPNFTPARFSTGQSEERAIITSTGPYVITWNLRRVKQGHLYEYQIKRYEDKIVADNFRFGQDRSIVVTLPEHVTLISKRSLAAPSPNALRKGRGIVDEYS